MQTLRGKKLNLLHQFHPDNLTKILLSHRDMREDFESDIIHDP
jgi:hypothetical protein